MRIQDAIVVTIDFDCDIDFNEGTFVFTEKEEVMFLVYRALREMNLRRKTYDWDWLSDADWLSEFIYDGGSCFGNWEIHIDFTSEKAHNLFKVM